MCTSGDQLVGDVAEALRMMDAALDCLDGPTGAELEASSLGGVLQSLNGISGSQHALGRCPRP